MEGFSVTIIISRKLYKDYNLAYLNRFRPLYKNFLFWECLLLVGYGLFLVISDNEHTNNSVYILFGVPLMLVFVRWLSWRRAGSAYDSNTKLQKPIEYSVTTEHIKMRGENFETIYPWNEVLKIKKTDKFVAVFVTKVSSLLFPADQVSDEEIAFIEQQFKKVKQ